MNAVKSQVGLCGLRLVIQCRWTEGNMGITESPWESPDNVVFHYTSQKGLLGIVSSKTIWATDVRYLSDSAELEYAVRLARDELAEMRKSASAEESPLWELIDHALSLITRKYSTSIYVCSFSSSKDLLSQWRGYCPEGSGFSIGLDFFRLQQVVQEQGFRSARCVYEEREQERIIKEFLAQSLGDIRKFSTGSPDQQRLEVAASIIGLNFEQIAPIIKHPKFSEEQEWRLISIPILFDNPGVKFREGKSMVIPYYELKLARDGEPMIIPEVVIGPTPHRDLAWTSVYNLLWSHDIQCHSVGLSEIPYRTW